MRTTIKKPGSKVYLIPAIVGLGLFLIANLIYYIKVGGSVTSDPAHWGQYGDFIGGLLNPALGILNLIVLVYLTYTVAHLEDGRNKTVLEVQKKIAISEMRYKVIELLLNDLSFVNSFKEFSATNEFHTVILKGHSSLIHIKHSYHFLFETLFNDDSFNNEYYHPLLSSIGELSSQCRKNIGDKSYDASDLIETFLHRKMSFISRIQQYVIEELDKK